MTQRPPHLLPGQSLARRSQLLSESPLESWHDEIARGGIFSAEKLAALAVVLGIILSQVSLIAAPAGASGVAANAVDEAYVVAEGGSLGTVGGTWHLAGWRLRRSITFDNTGRSQLDDFPILVRLDPADIDYSRVLGSGEDLRFIDSDGTPLDYEIEDWNAGGVSYVWVRVPQIDAGSTTDSIWMYYDNDSESHDQNAAGVWSNGYVGVWHMNQDPGASQILDSTSYLNHGSANNMDGSNLQPGAIGDGLSFAGVVPDPDYIRIPSDGADELSITGTALTLEAWAERTGDNSMWSIIVGRQLGSGGSDSFALFGDQSNPDRVSIVGPDNLTGDPGALPLDQWRYVAGVRDGAYLTLYSVGSQVGQFTGLGSSISTDVNDVTIGAEENDGSANPTEAWLGMLDEVRISNVARSADWVDAQNASMTDTFAAYGSEEEAGVLANDTDPESDPLTAALDGGPSHAAAFSLNPDGSFSYTPAAGMSGTDIFTYVANDGTGDSNTATVTITVLATGPNSPPDAVHDPSATTDRDVAVIIDVLANDSDPDLDGLSVSAVTQGGNGSVVNNGTDVTYTPDPGWTGVDTFTYEATDSNGGFDTATVTVTVAANNAPVAAPDSDSVPEDGSVLIDVLANDSDPDTDPLSVDSVTQGAAGSVANNGTNVTYTPNPDWFGVDTFTYTISDGQGGFATATVTVTVASAADAPVLDSVGNQSVTLGDTLTFTATASDDDPGDVLRFSLEDGPGSVPPGATIDQNTGDFSWTPGAIGSFTFSTVVTEEGSLGLPAAGGWLYQRRIEIGPATPLANYQVRVDLSPATFDYSNAATDGDDLRFFETDGTPIDYWIETWNPAGLSSIWVEVPSVGATAIYMRYGNVAASATSDGSATFVFFDDFESGSLGAAWTAESPGCSVSVVVDPLDPSNFVVDDGTDGGGWVHTNAAGDGSWASYAVRQWFRVAAAGQYSHAGLITRWVDDGNMVYGGIISPSPGLTGYTDSEIWNRVGGSWMDSSGASNPVGGPWQLPDIGTGWHIQELKVVGDQASVWVDNILVGTTTLRPDAPAAGSSGFWCQYGERGYRDNHLVREFVGSDPVGFIGPEESAGVTGGLTDSETIIVDVTAPPNLPPTADAGGPYNTDEGEDLILDGSGSSDPDTDPLTYNWDVDNDGQYDDATGPNPTVAWLTLVGLGFDDDGGPYSIGLEVDDGNGNTDTATVNWTIANTAPTILTTGSGSADVGVPYALNLSVTDPGNDTVTEWIINWGDGTVETVPGNPPTASHTYLVPGLSHNILASVADEDSLPNLPWHQDRMIVPGLFAARQLYRLDATTGAVYDNIGAGTGLGWAIAATIGPDGMGYVGSYTTDRIYRFDPAAPAPPLVEWVSFQSGGLDGPAGMEFGPNGNLFVSSNFGDEILEYNALDGSPAGVFVSFQSGGLDEPDDLTFGPDGHLYVTSFDTDEVLRYNGTDGTFMNVFASGVEMNQPSELTFGPDGHLYVTSVANDHVVRYNGTDGTLMGVFAIRGATGLNQPRAATFGPDGHLYVGGQNRIVRYDGSSGLVIDTYLPSGSISGPSHSVFVPGDRVTVNWLPSISGRVFEDIAGDILDDGTIGDANNPGAAGVDVYLYDGTNTLVATQATDPWGFYTFHGVTADTYTVRVDSRTVPSAQDPGAVQGDIWAVQTYGPDTAPCADGSGSPAANAGAGSCYGGSSGALSDGDAFWNHRVALPVAGSTYPNVDFGFSFNVVVNTRGGDGTDDDLGSNRTVQGSLEQFIQNANAISGPNSMRFVPVEPTDATDGSGNDWWSIGVAAGLPTVSDPETTIDGTAYQLADGVTLRNTNALGPELELNGAGTAATVDGLLLTGGTSAVRDLVINRFGRDGIRITTVGSNTIAGNYLGTDATGTANLGNINNGIFIVSAPSNTIGGLSVADRNVISGNNNNGLLIDGAASTGNVIQGNYVGLNAAGTGPIGNTDDGVDISDAPGNTIGGTDPAARNVIGGQGDVGLLFVGALATGNVAVNNYIGTNAAGNGPMPNGTGASVITAAAGNRIGGVNATESNLIAYNTGDGVWVTDTAGANNAILGNSIHSNGGLGIDADLDGVTPNGPGAPLDFPVITSASETAGTVALDFDLDVPAGDYRIEFFDNTAVDLSGNGEGETYLDFYDVVGHLGGSASYSTMFAGSAGDLISATATGEIATPFGSTSEFSATFTVTVADTTAPVITLVGANPQVIEVGSPYVELGATALDDVDGNITGSIVIDATAVNTAALGSYSVAYDVTDSSGNPAVQVVRTVDVVDTTVPVLTLLGANPQTIEVGSPYVELGATATDNYDGDLTGSIVINSSAVNTAVVGVYVVTYDVVDSSGNLASGLRTVNIVDTTVPVITLLGANPQTIEVGSPYSELGATASDNYDGDITGSIVINASAVNTAVVGSYVVTYDVADSEGNAATQVTRTVDVVDTTLPVITLLGANPQTIEVGSPYSELGATASDNYDGDITGSIVINSSAVNTAVVGSYVVAYDVTDSEGNAAVQVTRTVDVVDTGLPIITLVGADPVTVEVGSPYVDAGATAWDALDGDLTASIVTVNPVNTAVVGSYVVTYDVTDSNLNAAVQVTRTVNVVDTTIPVISLIGANPQVIEVGSGYTELGATASDNYDGDLTGSIVIDSSAVNTAVVAAYSVTYDVTDSEGNAAVQVTRTVDVVDTTVPVISLIGANPQAVEVGSSYVELGATATDNYDGDISGSIVIDASAVVTSVVGSYAVTYDVTDSEGNAAVQVTRTIDVVDTTAPVITLVGANPQVIEAGSAYVELGATAFDIGDGDVTGSIVVDSSAVNTATVGSYPVTYDVTDSQGNAAVQVMRTVDVVDTTLPVITLVGANPQNIEAGSPYVELGATALDNYDGDITPSIVIDATAVDTATVGSYPVTYNVTDSEGNAATQVTRTVNVTDTTAPVITLVGPNPQVIEVGSAYVELGATAFDIGDGDVTGSIVIDATSVDTAVVGSYSVTYDITDSQGNAAIQVVRTADVVDTTLPVITLVGPNPQVIEVGSPYVEQGATALDNYDGDISGSIVINASAVNTNVVGTYAVTYDVVDSSGNPAVAFRTVDVVDTTLPAITLQGANPQVIEVHLPYTELGATALDNYDGDISGSIVIDASAVNTAVVGTYVVTYDVTDSNGNAAIQVTRTVDVVDTTAPVITLVGADPQTVGVGSPYAELGATALDNYDGDISSSIVIDASAVNTAVVGTYVVTYNVTDSNGNAAIQVTRTVDVVNVAPTLNFIGDQTVAETTLATFTATASDPDPTDVLSFSLVGAPAGAGIDPVTGIFTWTPTEAQGPGIFAFDVVVTDSAIPALSDTQTVAITVTEVNLPPVLGLIPPQTVDELTVLSFVAPASDPDVPANARTFILTGAPAGATIDPATGVFTWLPSEAQGPGVYVFDVTVSDGGTPVLSDSQPVTVTVNEINLAPMVNSPGPQSSAEANVITLPIVAVDPDIPVNTLAYAATGLPDGLSIDAATGVISGTIGYTANAASPFDVVVTVTDNGAPVRSGQTNFAWTVADTNRDPIAGNDTVSTAEDTTVVIDARINDTDPDGDPLSVIGFSPPANGTADLTAGTLRYRPDANYNGPDSFMYTVADGRGGFAIGTIDVVVTAVNDSPVVNALTSLSIDEGAAAIFVASATDVEGDAVTFSLAGEPSGATISAATGRFAWTPSEAQGPGSYVIDVIGTDDGSPAASTTRQVTINVAEVNEAPVIVNPGTTVTAENEAVSLAIVATDPDLPRGTLRYSASGLPSGLSIDPATGEISGVIPFDGTSGSPYTVTITVRDDGVPELSTSAGFTWVVTNTNRAPTAYDIAVFADAGVPVSLILNGTDPDGDPLSFSISSPPTQGTLTGGPRLYDYMSPVTASGMDSFTYTVSDGDLQATGVVTVTITPNLPPTGGPDEYTVRTGGVLVVDAPGVLRNDRDPEGEPISAILASPPQHGDLTLEPDGSFTYRNTGGLADIDVFSYRIDDGMQLSSVISVIVSFVDNVAPTAENDTISLAEDTSAVFFPLANDFDENDEPILANKVDDPAHGTIDWSLDGAFVYRPARDWNGTEVISYEITDGDLVASASITIEVKPVNDPPVASPAQIIGQSGEPLTIDLSPYATDVDGDPIEFILESPHDASVIEIGSGLFEINLDGVISDLPPLTFVASDPLGGKDTSLLTIVVEIPAGLVGVPSLVSDDLSGGNPDAAAAEDSEPPGGGPMVTGLRLMVGSVLDTFSAFRIPMAALLLVFLGSLLLGFSKRFAFSSAATALPMGARTKVDIVMAPSSAGVPAREEPGSHQGVVHRFAPDAAGIGTTGARSLLRSELWIEVETPDGSAWVNAEFLTEQQSAAVFRDDERPGRQVADFVDRLYHNDDLLPVTGGRDLHVALYGPPVRFAAGALPRMLSGGSVYWWWGPEGDTPRHQGTFAEAVGEAFAMAYRNQGVHALRSTLAIPVEFVNMHSLVVGNHELGEGWRVFYRIEGGEPLIAGLMSETVPNPAAMHGRSDLQTV